MPLLVKVQPTLRRLRRRPLGDLPQHMGPARIYQKGCLGPFRLLWQLDGSPMPRVVPWGTIAAMYTALLKIFVTCEMWPSYCQNGHPAYQASERNFLFIHTYPYQFILIASGFGLVFRLSQSLTRYWEARSASQSLAAKWADAVLMTLTFDEEAVGVTAESKEQCAAFARSVLHLASLLHAVALHQLRGDCSLDTIESRKLAHDIPGLVGATTTRLPSGVVWYKEAGRNKAFARLNPIPCIGGLSESERRKLHCAERAHVVIGWLTRLIVRRRKRGGLSSAEAPVVSRIYQVLSDGNLWFLNALKVADTPFPFAYSQFNALICFINLGLFPILVADKVASLPLAIAISFVAISFVFGLNEVARDLEDPFSTDLGVWIGANRLDAPRMQSHFDERLLHHARSCGVALWPDGPECYGSFLEDAVGQPDDCDEFASPQASPSPLRKAASMPPHRVGGIESAVQLQEPKLAETPKAPKEGGRVRLCTTDSAAVSQPVLPQEVV